MNIEERQAIQGSNLLLFDGLCGMCNGLIRFLIRRDSGGHLIYAPLESRLGQEILSVSGLPPKRHPDAPPRWPTDGVVLVESALTVDQTVSVKSDAVIRVLHLLPGRWRWLGKLLSKVPRAFRERGYGWVARWRYSLFGAYTTCPIPSPRERALILGIDAGSSH